MTAVRIDLEIRTATPKVLNDHAKFDRAGGGVLDLRPSPGHRRNSPILHRVNRSNNSPADHARCPNSGRFLFSSAKSRNVEYCKKIMQSDFLNKKISKISS
jgi:hypothetical protein